MDTKSKEIPAKQYPVNGKILTFTEPLIMAIVNLTPDSFYDGGKYSQPEDVIRDVAEKVKQGATIIDIGGASSRPNAPETDEATEWKRLQPVLPLIRKSFPGIFISIDTYRPAIAVKCAEAGADIINDISGGDAGEKMFETVAGLGLPYIMMHMEGKPQTMANNPPYQNVLKSVREYFIQRIRKLENMNFSSIILDPGFGFGKSLENNYQLLKGLGDISELGYPLLAGVSRKSMINRVIGSNPVTSLNGTTVLNTIALLNGASLLRVHDVAEAKQAIALVEYYKNV
jgi:dihydropteroate synthase